MNGLKLGTAAILAAALNTPALAESPGVPAILIKAEAAVAAELRDSDSAQFIGVEHIGRFICGYVNAKNGYGGYKGAVGFVFIPPSEQPITSVYDNAQVGTVIFADDDLLKSAMVTLCRIGQ